MRGVVADVAVGVGDRSLELAGDCVRVVEQLDHPGVALGRLGHLRRRVLEVHHPRPGFGNDGRREDERLAEAVVEADGDIARDLDVLTLVVADGDFIGVVEQDVGRLQCRVGEQAGRDEVAAALGRLVLELRHPAELAVADVALHQPGQLGVLGHVALHEHGGDIWIEAGGEQDGSELDRALADDARADPSR